MAEMLIMATSGGVHMAEAFLMPKITVPSIVWTKFKELVTVLFLQDLSAYSCVTVSQNWSRKWMIGKLVYQIEINF